MVLVVRGGPGGRCSCLACAAGTCCDLLCHPSAALQVCSYRCITSYESRLLEEFSLCIIQKHVRCVAQHV